MATAPGKEVERAQPPAEVRRQMALTPAEQRLAKAEGMELIPLEDGRRMWQMTPEIINSYNLLTPITSIVQVNDSWYPQMRPVALRPNKDTYKVGSTKEGDQWVDMHAIRGGALSRLADVTGIEKVRAVHKRTPDGYIVTATARMRGPDGLFKLEERSYDVNFTDRAEELEIEAVEKWEKYNQPLWERKQAGEKLTGQAAKEAKPPHTPRSLRKLILADRNSIGRKCESGAYNRCIRALLGIDTMPEQAFRKPFVGVCWYLTPQWNREGTRELVAMQYNGSTEALYGPQDYEQPETAQVTVTEGGAFDEQDGGLDEPPVLEADEHGQVIGTGPGETENGASNQVEKPEAPAEQPAAATGEPEEWNLEEEPEARPEPDAGFALAKSGKSPFAGMHVRDIVAREDGRVLLIAQAKRVSDPAKREQLLAWLSWQAGRDLTLGDL